MLEVTDPLVGAWGVWTDDGRRVWVADGPGGLKRIEIEGTEVIEIVGDDREGAPGWVFAVAAVDEIAVAAVGGRGVAIYDRATARRLGQHPLPGLCVDVDVDAAGQILLTCGGWIHLIEAHADGTIDPIASRKLHRQPIATGGSTHLAMSATVVDDTFFVSGWDHLTAFRPVLEARTDAELSSQRLHLPQGATSGTFTVTNAGTEALSLHPMGQIPAFDLVASQSRVEAGGQATVTLDRRDGDVPLNRWFTVATSDPDEPVLPILALADQPDRLDPGEIAPGFALTALAHDAAPATVDLSAITASGSRVFFPIFGTW